MTPDRHDDDAFADTAAEWDRRLAAAGDALDAAAPGPAVWERVSARIDQLEAARPTLTVRAGEGVWEPVSPGVMRKTLHVNDAEGWQAFLLKLEPGAQIEPHGHTLLEECVVLEGAFEIGGEWVRKGDLHLAFPGHDHSLLHSPDGALLYIRGALDT
ncbi:cupin domain-containing protein [Caulobacter sp. KR2-114]|uniref:cupin domain-containing protein n=1 Tax=Caulobacter sp. KR2-114 TaxID=3400912 RepID=UPI003C119C0D